jgi:hypothetical protein
MSVFDNFNIRQLQAYAAISMLSLCRKFEIKSQEIDHLIHHLLHLLTADDLSEWEKFGAILPVSGRGDAFPQSVVNSIKGIDAVSFREIMESCVEIGIVDLYGANTNQPWIFFDSCLKKIQSYGVELPSPSALKELRAGIGPWGDPVEAAKVDALIRALDNTRTF